MLDMMKMMGKMKEIQEKMREAQENLVHVTSEAESGGGMVKAVVNGKRQVVNLEIDPDILGNEDREMVQDLVIAAINTALRDVEVKAKEEIKKSTEGVIPNIPGFDLGSMM